MGILEVILRIAHIAPAIIVGGALIYRLLAVQPVLQTLDAGQRQALGAQLARRWLTVLSVSMALLLVSGLLNFVLFKVPAVRGQPYAGLYHGLFGLKLLAALALFHAALVLTMPGERFDRYRARAEFWLTWATFLLVVVVVVAVILRYLPTL